MRHITISSSLLGIALGALSAVPQRVESAAGIPIPANTWVKVPTNGIPPAAVGFDTLVYAPAIKKSVMWGDYHNVSSEPNEAMVAYDFATNRWDLLALGGNFHSEQLPEGGHPGNMMVYNPAINSFISYCCHSGSQAYERPFHTWIFDAIGLVGRNKQPPTKPGLTDTSGAAFDVAHNVFVFFDGAKGTWTYDVIANTWTKKTPKGSPPPALSFFGMAYNSRDQQIYLFGGQLGNGYANDLYTYDVPTDTWTKLEPEGTRPSGRNYMGFAYESVNNIFFMFGGSSANPGSPGYVLNDSYVYDPVANRWTQLSPVQSPPIGTSPSYTRLAYDSDNNVFVAVLAGPDGYAGGNAAGYSVQTWLYRYAGTGPNAGTLSPQFSPPSGSINRNSDGWAKEPALASSGSTLYAGWTETGKPYDVTASAYSHPYAAQLTGSSWSALGGSYLSLDSEGGGYNEAHSPSLAVIGGRPWISWYKTNSSGTFLPNSLYAKSWTGSSWAGGPVGAVNASGAANASGRSQIVGIGTTPYIAFIEVDRTSSPISCYPWCNFLYVKSWTGSAWALKGTKALNRKPATGNIAESVSITSDGVNPIVAWTEYTQAASFQADSPPQVYVSILNGSSWQALGESLNVDPSNYAYDATITYLNNQPYVAWTERSQTGNNQVYVKTWTGSSWALVGSQPLNKDTATGWAFRPALATDGGNLYIAWVEQQILGQKAQTYVSRWSGSSWTALGTSLNLDAINGSSERVALAILDGQPAVAWGEVRFGSMRQIYVKQWNGSTWVMPSGEPSDTTPPSFAPPSTPAAPSTPTGLIATALSSSQITLSWTASTGAVVGYRIYRAGTQIGTSTTPSYNDTGLSASTNYSYAVAAYDAGNNLSAQSVSAAATTQAGASLAPGVPSTYNTSHPRLPVPSQAYLLALAANQQELAKYNAAANSFDPANPVANTGQFRRALIAYMANKAAGNNAAAAVYLTKFKQLADLGGTWGQLLYKVDDAVGNGSLTLTSASANFLTGCGGGSCAGNILSIQGRIFSITQVVNANTINISNSNPAPVGTKLPVRILSGYESYVGVRMAMVYDWLYNDLDTATRTAYLNQLEVIAKIWEENYKGLGASPYNDVFYIRYGFDGFLAAFAIYPDFDNQNPAGGTCPTKPCGTYHINFMMDKLFTVFLPVWHQVFGEHGGGWHEDWAGYVNDGSNVGMTEWIVPVLLSWQSASGQPIFAQNSWIKNFAYWTMYMTRPDFTMEHIGEVATGTLTPEYNINYDVGAPPGSLNGLAEIYDDPVLRGWARLVNQEFGVNHDQPSGFEPSAWPFYTPDSKDKPASSRAPLPTSRDFDGWGTVFARSGWGEADTYVTLRYGDNYWSHTRADAGAFTIFHRGSLAIASGNYRPGSNSPHEIQYGRQTISQNSLLIVDPNDAYPNKLFPSILDEKGNSVSMPLANDGGQRRAGTFYNLGVNGFNQFVSPDCYDKRTSPGCVNDWLSNYDYYHMGSLVAYDAKPEYTYAAVDITPAYNNKYSTAQGDAVNRTARVTSVIRNMVFMPPGYVIIYDSVNATNASFKKKWLLHSINQPLVAGNRYEIRRTENATRGYDWTPHMPNC